MRCTEAPLEQQLNLLILRKTDKKKYLSTKKGVRNTSVLSGNLLTVQILNYVACFVYLSYNKKCLTV